MDDEEDNWGFDGMVAAEYIATSGICGTLREVHRVCEDDGDAVSTTIVDVFELAGKGIEAKRKHEAMSGRQTNLEAELVDIWDARHTISRQIAAAEERVKS